MTSSSYQKKKEKELKSTNDRIEKEYDPNTNIKLLALNDNIFRNILRNQGNSNDQINELIELSSIEIPENEKERLYFLNFGNQIRNQVINNVDSTKYNISYDNDEKYDIDDKSNINVDLKIEDKINDKSIIINYVNDIEDTTQYKKIYDCIHKNANENLKILIVVNKKFVATDEKSKINRLFKIGFENKTICYIKNMINIINDFFGEN